MVVSLRVLVTPGDGLVASGAGLCMGISNTFEFYNCIFVLKCREKN